MRVCVYKYSCNYGYLIYEINKTNKKNILN